MIESKSMDGLGPMVTGNDRWGRDASQHCGRGENVLDLDCGDSYIIA